MSRLARDVRARAQHTARRAEAFRGEHRSVDAVYTMFDRDLELGGGLLSGSLAYRIFVWLLPFALVLVGGIGVAASASEESPERAARALGLQGLVSNSVAEATHGSSRWYALLIGIPLLLWATRGLLKALIVVHRLVWGDSRRVSGKATPAAIVRLLLLLVAYFAVQELSRWVEVWTGSVALRLLVGLGGVFAWWIVVSVRLPHGDARWTDLLPGAALMAVGLQLVSALGVYLAAPRVESSRSTYGALGIAAVLLFGLFIVSRLVVASAVLNATACERRRPPAEPA